MFLAIRVSDMHMGHGNIGIKLFLVDHNRWRIFCCCWVRLQYKLIHVDVIISKTNGMLTETRWWSRRGGEIRKYIFKRKQRH